MAINARLPDDFAEQISGGPAVAVTVQPGDTGVPYFNVDIAEDGEEWSVAYVVLTLSEVRAIAAIFRAHVGPAHPFRMKIWYDFQLTNELIGTGDGVDATWQVIKTYASADRSIVRNIRALKTGLLTVSVAGVVKTETTHYTVNYTTGVITFTIGNIPTAAQEIRVTGEFDIYAYFADRNLGIRILNDNWGEITNCRIKEYLGAVA